METTKKIKCAFYFRVSTVEQSLNQSLTVQKELLTKYAEYSNFEIVNEYIDAGFSGRNVNRLGLQDMLTAVDNKEFDYILVYSLSRLGRNSLDTLNLMKRFQKNNVTLFSYTEKIDTSSAFATFMFSLLSSLSELESNLISERVKTVKNEAKINQRRFSSHLMGFNCQEKNLTINESEMQVIKKIYKLKSENISLNKIAKILNDSNTKTSKDTKFYPSTISKILKNKLIYEKHL